MKHYQYIENISFIFSERTLPDFLENLEVNASEILGNIAGVLYIFTVLCY